MGEADLFSPVRDWLVSNGYEIHVEVFDADIVATRNQELTVVEMKACLSSELICQLRARAHWADFVIAAISARPRSTNVLKHCGFGLIRLGKRGAYLQIQPKRQPWHFHRARAYRQKILAGRKPAMCHEVAGLRAGPVLVAQRRLRGDL